MARYFTTGHLWIDVEGPSATVGLTDHGQSLLGALVLVQLPAPGRVLAKDEPVVLVESIKAATEIATPLGGTVRETNAAVEADPELVNADAEGAGWLYRLMIVDGMEPDGLLDATTYREVAAGLT